MLGREIHLVAASALGVSAFLIPAGVTAPVRNLALPVSDPKNQLVRVPCAECVFPFETHHDLSEEAVDSEERLWIQGGANDVLLNLSVTPKQTLEVNGHQIFPAGLEPVLAVVQVPASTSDQDVASGNARSASLDVTRSFVGYHEHMLGDNSGSLVTIRLDALEIESSAIVPDEIVIQLMKDADGELLILDTAVVPSSMPPVPHFISDAVGMPVDDRLPFFRHAPPVRIEHDTPRCGPNLHTLCQVKDFIKSKAAELKSAVTGKKAGCHGAPRVHVVSGLPDLEDFSLESGRPRLPPPPHRSGHRHRHHGHRHHHSFFRSAAHGFVAIVIPTLAGVFVGMTISIIGLVIGKVVSVMWVKLVRGGRPEYAPVALEDSEAMAVETTPASKTYLDETPADAPPQYEEAPAYKESKDGQ